MVPNKWDNFRLNSCISIGELVKPLHKKIFSKLIFATTLAVCHNHIYLFFLGIVYKMCVIFDYFVYSESFLLCYLDMHIRISCLIIYYLIPHVLRKCIMSYLCYPGTPPYHLPFKFCKHDCH